MRCSSFPHAGAGTAGKLWPKLFALAASPVAAEKPWETFCSPFPPVFPTKDRRR